MGAEVESLQARGDPPSGPPPPAAEPARPGSRRLAVVLGGLLALAVGGLAYQTHRAAQLGGRVEALSAALAEAEAAVEAHRDHLGAIQGEVTTLRERFDALEALVRRGPSPPGNE